MAVEAFFDGYVRGLQIGDASQLSDVMSERCEMCGKYVATVDALRVAGVRCNGGEISIPEPSSVGDQSATRRTWRLTVNQAELHIVSPDGSATSEEATQTETYIALELESGHWRIVEIGDSTRRSVP